MVSTDERPFVCTGDPNQLLLIADEATMMSALDPKQILSWPDFEYILCFIIENRLLRLYQAHLEKQYQQKWKEMDYLLNEEGNVENSAKTPSQAEKKKKKRRKQKKRNKKSSVVASAEDTTIAS